MIVSHGLIVQSAIYEGCRFEFYQGHGPRALADFSMYF